MEQLTPTTKSFIFDRIKELEITLQLSESFMEEEPEHKLYEFYKIKIEAIEREISFLKDKLFS